MSLRCIDASKLVSFKDISGTKILVVGIFNFDVSQAQQFSPEQRAQICNPNNPRLNFVNSTESDICNIPESVKNQTTTDNSTTPTPSSITPSAVSP